MFDESSHSPIDRPPNWRPRPLQPILIPAPPTFYAPVPDRPPNTWRFRDMVAVGLGIFIALVGGYPLGLATLKKLFANDPNRDLLAEVGASFWVYIMVFLLSIAISLLMGKTWRDFGFRLPENWLTWSVVGVVLGVVLIPVRLMLIIILVLIFEPSYLTEQNNGGGATGSEEFTPLLLLAGLQGLIMVVIFAPLVEELVFRGILQPWVRGRFGIIMSILVSGFLFGLAHRETYMVISNTLMGFVLAGVYEKTGSLWMPMLIHFVNNSIVAVFVVLAVMFVALMGV